MSPHGTQIAIFINPQRQGEVSLPLKLDD